jgi:hypothetical protein
VNKTPTSKSFAHEISTSKSFAHEISTFGFVPVNPTSADERLGGRRRVYRADDWSGTEFRGIVMILPNRRGYIAGWTDSVHAEVDYDIYDSLHDAAIAGDNLALSACEKEIEFQLNWEVENEVEEV